MAVRPHRPSAAHVDAVAVVPVRVVLVQHSSLAFLLVVECEDAMVVLFVVPAIRPLRDVEHAGAEVSDLVVCPCL